MGVLLERASRSVLQPRQLIGAETAQAVGLEVHHIDQADKMHALVIEAVIAAIIGRLAEAGEIFAAHAVGDVMLAGHGVKLASL